ncbi:hypothetical protein JHK87_047784 [Glycine soja]|nr:hypothetical protein JHK87_047784 [Glycine soja]
MAGPATWTTTHQLHWRVYQDMTVKVYEDGGYFIDDEDLTPSEIAFYQGVYGEEISREHVASSDRELDSLGDESDHFEEMTLP